VWGWLEAGWGGDPVRMVTVLNQARHSVNARRSWTAHYCTRWGTHIHKPNLCVHTYGLLFLRYWGWNSGPYAS
jgi:hypothetical protein